MIVEPSFPQRIDIIQNSLKTAAKCKFQKTFVFTLEEIAP